MNPKVTGILLICLSVVLLTATQLIIKSRLAQHGAIPFAPRELVPYAWSVLHDWRLLAGFVVLVVAAFCWYAALSRIPLSIAFPFGALSYPLVFLGSALVLKEGFQWQLLAGNLLIVAGLLVIAATGRS